jgi:ABC-type sugar transport system substrate-binding protein
LDNGETSDHRLPPESGGKVLAILLLAASSVVRAAALPPVGNRQAAPHAEPLTISFLLASMDAERYETDRDAFTDYVAAHGGRVLFASAGGDPARQERQLAEHLARGAQVVVLQPVDVLRTEALSRAAMARKVPVVAYDRQVPGPGTALYVTHDHLNLGALQVAALQGRVAQNGRILICMGQADSLVTQEITRGNELALARAGYDLITKIPHATWSAAACKATVLRALQSGPLGAVLANNGRMALGAAEAVEAFNGKGKILVVGGDMTQASCRAVADGRLALDIKKSIGQLAETAAKAALELAQGKSVPNAPVQNGVPTLRLPVHPVDRPEAQADGCGS